MKLLTRLREMCKPQKKEPWGNEWTEAEHLPPQGCLVLIGSPLGTVKRGYAVRLSGRVFWYDCFGQPSIVEYWKYIPEGYYDNPRETK